MVDSSLCAVYIHCMRPWRSSSLEATSTYYRMAGLEAIEPKEKDKACCHVPRVNGSNVGENRYQTFGTIRIALTGQLVARFPKGNRFEEFMRST